MMESASEFVRLRTSENPVEYHRAAHDVASDEVWAEVITSYPEMAEWVAHNKTISLGSRLVAWLFAARRDESLGLWARVVGVPRG